MSRYDAFVTASQLVSPDTGYTCRRISKQNIKQFGFESIDALHDKYPGFPTMCLEYQRSRDVSNTDAFKASIQRTRKSNKANYNTLIEQYNIRPNTCLMCNAILPFKKRKNKYCSTTCSNVSRGPRSVQTKDKISKSVKANPAGIGLWTKEQRIANGKNNRKPRKTIVCKTCKSIFTVIETSNKIYCCKECNPNIGGARIGSGRSKSGYYKDIYCGSTYELVWVMYNLYHNIPFQRFEGYIDYIFNGKHKKYFPDFLQYNKIVEIKGFYTPMVDVKARAAMQSGYTIDILYKKDLALQFEWFSRTFPNKKLYQMYDDYKPVYQHICHNCSKPFTTDKPRKTVEVFCSKHCTGRYRAYKNHG